VVFEVMEGSLIMAFHALMLMGLPMANVMRRIQAVRESRYELMRGFFRGATDEEDELDEEAQPRLCSVLVGPESAALGRTLAELELEDLSVDVVAVRRRGIKGLDPQPETRVEAGDVLVLRGTAEDLDAAEIRLLPG
jgi:CPA2 family monovalent cation:H+ antiporter-2